jgi:GABA(A) receptor-associated protein
MYWSQSFNTILTQVSIFSIRLNRQHYPRVGMASYKSTHSFDQRSAEAFKIKQNFPGRVPVILEMTRRTKTNLPVLDKQKFLVPGDLTIGQFIYVVRKRMALPPEMALFIFANNTLPPTGTILRELYAASADPDGFLYMEYSGENTFGASGY